MKGKDTQMLHQHIPKHRITMVERQKSRGIACKPRSLKRALVLALLICAISPAQAQTPLHKAPADTSNPCSGPEGTVDLAECGMEASRNQNYSVARTAWSRAAEGGDHLAAIWLAELHENGHGGEKDYVEAYKWYDIAAAIHAAEIDKFPPGAIESNQQELNYRDYVARRLTTTQIADAQKLAREWLVRHPTRRK
jgi:hypothetical protein